jgi:hypothetical protein
MTFGLPVPGWVTHAAKAFYPLPVRRVRDFVIGFLQIPPRGGHPCLDGWFRSSRPMGDFHPLNANASHTEHTPAVRFGVGFGHEDRLAGEWVTTPHEDRALIVERDRFRPPVKYVQFLPYLLS